MMSPDARGITGFYCKSEVFERDNDLLCSTISTVDDFPLGKIKWNVIS
jgi:hypothetical protein